VNALVATLPPGAVPAPLSLIEELLLDAKVTKDQDGFGVYDRAIRHFVTELVGRPTAVRADKSIVDAKIADIDQRLSAQVNAILHHPDFQRLESAWRSLKFLVDKVDFRQNVTVEMLNVSKDDLINDFEDAPEVSASGLYKRVYSAGYGTFGGSPIGLIVGNYEFGAGPKDITLLQRCAAVGAMSHAPFVAAASPRMFGAESWEALPGLRDLKGQLEGPQYARWHAFRESEDARYVGLCMPRFLLRLPYGASTIPVKKYTFEEDCTGDHGAYLWGNAAVALASRVADSFAKYRWCPNIIGPQAGGTVDDLPLHQYAAMGEIQTKVPTEVQISDRREFELAEEGFIAMTFRKGSDNACFFSANSCQKPKNFGQSPEGRVAETNHRLGTQLP
jgi:type VI secretion system protein ImpC